MQLQAMALCKNIFNTFRELFLRKHHDIYDEYQIVEGQD